VDKLGILQVSTFDIAGGAEAVALNLHRGYRSRGLDACLVVGRRQANYPGVLMLSNGGTRASWSDWWWTLADWLNDRSFRGRRSAHTLARLLAEPGRAIDAQRGLEIFRFPGTRRILEHMHSKPHVLHAHNLHGDYFDLRVLPWLSRQLPVVLTLHDTWLLSGHCAYAMDCQRWKTGCGLCPDLRRYAAIARDATAQNWHRKKAIYLASHLYIAGPSQWVLDNVAQSILAPAVVQSRTIPYGIDLAVFRPQNREEARRRLGLPSVGRVLLFVASGGRHNRHKDYATMRAAVARLAQKWQGGPLIFVVLGGGGVSECLGAAEQRFVPFQTDPVTVAAYYQAADVYLHAAWADTFPNAILEALACGTPVVATAVGGIPEQIQDGETGFLTPAGDSVAMAAALERVLADEALLTKLGYQASLAAKRRFDLERQVKDYLDYYQAALNDFHDRSESSKDA
jgi:glycosyltransferase involved in cell wall biosynthesis